MRIRINNYVPKTAELITTFSNESLEAKIRWAFPSNLNKSRKEIVESHKFVPLSLWLKVCQKIYF